MFQNGSVRTSYFISSDIFSTYVSECVIEVIIIHIDFMFFM